MASCHQCGCGDATRCGCCTGIEVLTPAAIENRPGLPALQVRVGTHGRFLASMQSRLPLMEVIAPGADHQTLETFRPLQALTTRDPADPAIAMLDAWATVGDVLTFYTERIANEGYLRTATERRSLVEMSRLVGYAPRPGVSASVYLSYTVDDNQAEPVEIPIGTRSQSIPGPGESPQSFETSEVLSARREWNDLQVRRQQPQAITAGSAKDAGSIATLATLHVAGTDTGVRPGDLLLFRFGADPADMQAWTRKAIATTPDYAAQRSAIALQPLPSAVVSALPLLQALATELAALNSGDRGARTAATNARDLLDSVRLGMYPPPQEWPGIVTRNARIEDGHAIDLIERFESGIKALPSTPTVAGAVTATPDQFVNALLLPPQLQAANALHLRRNLGDAFAQGADLQPQLLVDFAPRLKDRYYAAWRGSTPPAPAPALSGIDVLGAGELLFGATAALQAVSDGKGTTQLREWTYAGDETDGNAFLARADELLAAGDLVLVQQPRDDSKRQYTRSLRSVRAVATGPRTAYGSSGDSTRIEFDAPPWREVESDGVKREITALRQTRLQVQKRRLELAEMPIVGDVSGDRIELGPLHEALKSGRWVIFEGERSDIDGVDGVRVSELLMIAGLLHGYDPDLPGDRPHTTLRLATPTAYRYKRDSLRIHANVVPASHGETRKEVLGSGDATRPAQAFELRQPPLTWRPAPTEAGAGSTLKVLVNDVEWREVDNLAGLGADDRAYATSTDDDDKTSVLFGNGLQGTRPPTGFENIRAEYRSGIGKGGNVKAAQISLMVHRPLGVKEVVNPLAASGGADRESADLIRDNAPRSIIALDRLVSLSDYADFTRMYAGVAKADAVKLRDGAGELVHVTIAGVDDMAIDPDGDLYRNLLASLRALGDPGLRVRVAMRERIALALEARIRLCDGYRWEVVATAMRGLLLDRFGFGQRALARPALLCEIMAAMQSVAGVAWVDIDSFGGVPEMVADANGARRLITQEEITAQVAAIVGRATGNSAAAAMVERPAQRVEADLAAFEHGLIRPAQLAIFAPAIPDTLILNQIP